MKMSDTKIREKIFSLLTENRDEFLSGESLSSMLNVSRSAIWKHVRKLRQTGFKIEASPNKGYLLKDVPDELYPLIVKTGLDTKIIVKKGFFYKNKTSSTNLLAYKHAEKGIEEGAVFLAKEQTRGRGRFGRDWISPEGGIYFSIVLRPELAPMDLGGFSLMAGVSIADAIKSVFSIEPGLKWPNDILIEGRKIAGILIEMKAQAELVDFLIVGVGINFEAPLEKLPEGAGNINVPASLKGSKVRLFRSVLENFEENYFLYKKQGLRPFLESCRYFSTTLGNNVKVSCDGNVTEGKAVDIASSGALHIMDKNGKEKIFFSGDITLRRE